MAEFGNEWRIGFFIHFREFPFLAMVTEKPRAREGISLSDHIIERRCAVPLRRIDKGLSTQAFKHDLKRPGNKRLRYVDPQ